MENKPVYYDGSGKLPAIHNENYKMTVIKPEGAPPFRGIPYFPYHIVSP